MISIDNFVDNQRKNHTHLEVVRKRGYGSKRVGFETCHFGQNRQGGSCDPLTLFVHFFLLSITALMMIKK